LSLINLTIEKCDNKEQGNIPTSFFVMSEGLWINIVDLHGDVGIKYSVYH